MNVVSFNLVLKQLELRRRGITQKGIIYIVSFKLPPSYFIRIWAKNNRHSAGEIKNNITSTETRTSNKKYTYKSQTQDDVYKLFGPVIKQS